MDRDFVSRVMMTSLVSGLVLSIVATVAWGTSWGVGLFIGVLWSVVNLYFIGLIVRTLMSKQETGKTRVTLIMLVKVPVLYALGFWLLSSGRFPVVAMLAGFIWPLIVVTLKILGRAFLKMDEPKRIIEHDADLAAKRVQSMGKSRHV